VALGHIKHLTARDVDAVLLPSFNNLNLPGEEYSRGVSCPYTQTMPYTARVALEGIRVLAPVVDLSMDRKHLVKELKRELGDFGASTGRIRKAMKAADAAQAEFYRAIKEKGREVLSGIDQKALVIVGRSYNAMEKGVNLQIPQKLATLDVLAIPMDMLPTEGIMIKSEWPNMYWRSGQRMLRAARFIREHEHLYPLFIGNFSCGPDSFILKYFKDEMGDKPFLHLEIDEHSADAGAVTRCEAFLDSIEKRDDSSLDAVVLSSNGASSLAGRTVYLPRMLDHAVAVKAAFERAGVPAEVMPESDQQTLEVGMKYASGKECYPFILTTGDMVKTVTAPGFNPEKAAFFMPSGDGPCRFGNYNISHKKVLEKVGMPDIPVFAPNQDEGFYEAMGVVSKDFTLTAWKGIIAIELLSKCVHETRPYEKEQGSSDALYDKYLHRLYTTLRDDPDGIESVLTDMRGEFEAVPRTGEVKPLIGIVGEVYVRTNRFSNEDLIRSIEALGGEVWLAPFEEWMYYVNIIGYRKALKKRQWSAILDSRLKRYFQTKVEHRYAHIFEGFLRNLHEPTTSEVFRLAKPYVPDTFEGETVLSIGKTVDFVRKGAAGVVNAMPFGCMPGTIVTGILRALGRDFDIPVISIPYDGTESSTMQIQLEAFMDQAKSKILQRR
jgi:predicted nucleotide-binding protein (sugar kinase/HSP70/actin superfamily)